VKVFLSLRSNIARDAIQWSCFGLCCRRWKANALLEGVSLRQAGRTISFRFCDGL